MTEDVIVEDSGDDSISLEVAESADSGDSAFIDQIEEEASAGTEEASDLEDTASGETEDSSVGVADGEEEASLVAAIEEVASEEVDAMMAASEEDASAEDLAGNDILTEESDTDEEGIAAIALDEDTLSGTTTVSAPSDATYWCGHYYKVYNTNLTWEDAKTYCESLGGYLVTFSSWAEIQAVRAVAYISQSDYLSNYYIGAKYNSLTEGCAWINSETHDYGNIARWGSESRPYAYLEHSGNFYYGANGSGYYSAFYVGDGEIDEDTGFICEWGPFLSIADGEATLSYESVAWTGSPLSPSVTVVYDDLTLEENNDYTYVVTNNTNIGTATVTITGYGRFVGTITKTFSILPPKVSVVYAGTPNENRDIEFSWSAVNCDVTGYYFQYADNSDFSDATSVQLSSDTLTYTVEKAVRGSTVYARVYAYKTVNGQQYGADWSPVCSKSAGQKLIAQDFWGFENTKDKISKSYFSKFFGSEQAKLLSKNKSKNGEGGLCAGMSWAALASIVSNAPSVPSYGVDSLYEIKSISGANSAALTSTSISSKDYIKYAHAFKATIKATKEYQNNMGKVTSLASAVQSASKAGKGVIISMSQVSSSGKQGSGHSIIGLSVISSTSSETQIKVYDPNYPGDENRILYLYNGGATWKYSGTLTWEGATNVKDLISGTMNDRISYYTSTPYEYSSYLATALNSDYSTYDNYVLLSANRSADEIEKLLENMDLTWFCMDSSGEAVSSSDAPVYMIESSSANFTLDNVPAGTELVVATAWHSVTISTEQTASITVNIQDSKVNSAEVASSAANSFTVKFSDASSTSATVEQAVVTGTAAAGKTAVVSQTDSTVEVTNASGFSLTAQSGTEDDEGTLVNPTTKSASASNLTGDTTYTVTMTGAELTVTNPSAETEQETAAETAQETEQEISNLAGGTISSLTNKANGIAIQWSAVAGASGYHIYRRTASGSFALVTDATGASTVSYTDTAVKSKNGTTYIYKVVPYSGETEGTGTEMTTVRLTGTKLSSVKNTSSKKLTVKWKKTTKVSGYQIQYSTSKTFKKGNKTVKVSGAKKVKKVLSKLKKGKTYYVRIRTYKKVNGTTYYSAWSSKKKCKVTK